MARTDHKSIIMNTERTIISTTDTENRATLRLCDNSEIVVEGYFCKLSWAMRGYPRKGYKVRVEQNEPGVAYIRDARDPRVYEGESHAILKVVA
jgi:hypothetical protein